MPPDRSDILPAGKLPHGLLSGLLAEHIEGDDSVVLGPGVGRDAAVVQTSGDLLVVKSDPITFASDRSAEHLVHVNANDIACLGGEPKWLLVTALFPEGETAAELVERTFAELASACRRVGVVIVGGHTEITIGLDRPILVGAMLGEVTRARMVDPTRARPGDRLLLTKCAGIEGTALLCTELRDTLVAAVGSAVTESGREMLNDPGLSIVAEARLLSSLGLASALHDPTEGGVATAVHELAAAAGLGAFVARERIPIHDTTARMCGALGLDALGLLASGALLAAIPADRSGEAEVALTDAGIPWTWIGKLTPPEFGVRLRDAGAERDLPLFTMDEAVRALGAAS